MENTRLDQLLDTENELLLKLNTIVLKSIEEEQLLSHKLSEFEDLHPTFSNRVADKVATFGGSWKFIIIFLFIMLIWIGSNLYLMTKPFDPFPFILLNLVLSTIAALQAPVIMMSQNRKEDRDRQRAVNDYLVNLKSEVEIRNIHQKLDLLIKDQMQNLFEIQREQINLMYEIKEVIKVFPRSDNRSGS